MARIFSRLWRLIRSCVPGSSGSSPPTPSDDESPPISRSPSPKSVSLPRFSSASEASEDITDEQEYLMELRETWNVPRRRSLMRGAHDSNDSGYDSA